MRSPKSAPPVFRLDGSTETMAIVLLGKSIKYLRTSSSTDEDFPEPPVPVIPNTGIADFDDCSRIRAIKSACFSEKFSAAEIARPN